MSKFSVRKPLTVFMAVIVAIVLGIVSYTRMTPDLMPSIDLPYVVVVTSYPGATPEKVETVISKPVEQSMGTLDGIKNITSTSSENVSMIMLEFEEETNMDTATVDILQKLNQIEGYWDDMVGTPYIMKMNPNMMPVAVASVQMDGMDKSELSNFLDETILNRLEGTNGVASISTTGNIDEEVSVLLSQSKIDSLYEKIYAEMDKNFEEPQKQLDDSKKQLDEAMKGFEKAIADIESNPDMPADMKEQAKAQITSSPDYAQVQEGLKNLEQGQKDLDKSKEDAHKAIDLSGLLSMDTLSGILTAQDFAMPAGYVKQGNASWIVNVGDEIKSIEEVQNLVLADLKMDGIEPIRIKDVADVVVTDDSADIYAKINGEDGVVLSFSKQSSYATADVAENIAEKFDELSEEYEGLKFITLMNQGDYIHLVVNSITSSLLWGALFAVIVLFIFLRDIRPTFITLCSIPISVIFAIVLMYFSGVSLNMMSLSGLSIAVGMLVDNSIVVIENIYRLKSKGESVAKAAISGATQVAGAVTASTLTTICVFLPIVFVDGLTRTLFVDMALTLGYALIASLIISLTFVPATASKMLKKDIKKKSEKPNGITAKYKKAVTWCLSHKIAVFAIAIVLLVGSIMAEMSRGFTFMPDMDMPQLSATLETELGTSFEDTTALADEAMKRIQSVEDVETVGAMISSDSGMSMMGGGGSSNAVTFYIMLDENKKRSSNEIIKEINELCSDLDCDFEATGSTDVSALMGGSGISVNIYGDDLEQLQQSAKEVSEIVSGVEGTQNILNGLEENDPALKITVDKEKAMLNGLTVAQIFQEMSDALTTEKKAIDVIFDDTSYAVYVSDENTDSLSVDDIKNYTMEVTAQDGTVSEVKLSDVASVEETESLSSISRKNQKRYLTVSAEIADGYNVSLVSSDVEEALNSYEAPKGIKIEISGENENIMDSMKQLVEMLLLGVMLVYMIMVAQFQSLKSPFIIMFTIPLAFTGGMLGLFVTGFEISVISMLGFVMLCGIIVNNGIVLVDYINQLRLDGMERRKAIAEAGATRMRPIFMTSITTILGLIVMALGIGDGAEMMQPIAVVCIGGLLYATLLTLFVIPCLYDLMNKKELKKLSKEDLEISKL
ncbi:MAG: efflux RND transporter permease subunit [Oscillospiraceae bacterium]|nr:efflux RND transporter permease subunit [Oscillospiraceae bacterium]